MTLMSETFASHLNVSGRGVPLIMSPLIPIDRGRNKFHTKIEKLEFII